MNLNGLPGVKSASQLIPRKIAGRNLWGKYNNIWDALEEDVRNSNTGLVWLEMERMSPQEFLSLERTMRQRFSRSWMHEQHRMVVSRVRQSIGVIRRELL